MNFNKFKLAISRQFDVLVSSGELFITGAGKDELWDTYLGNFPEGSNPLYKERTEHDCQCCKQFIRVCGSVVAIIDNKTISIWDIEVGGPYQVVADALAKLVKSRPITDSFLHFESNLGTDNNVQITDSGSTITWEHFHYCLPEKFVVLNDSIPSALGDIRSNKEVFKRSLKEISTGAVETVLELIEQNSLYRGDEFKPIVELLSTYKNASSALESEAFDNYCWYVSTMLGGAAKIRNTVIGTLLTDITDDVELTSAVKSYEAKVAPVNYKRPTALITKGMIEEAQKKVVELGIEGSLSRRYAVTEDVTINNVLFADRTTRPIMKGGVFDELIKEVPTKLPNFDKVEAINITDFIENILPKAGGIELLLENKHSGNLMSLVAPIQEDAVPIFKWNNNFSWSYNGEVADSMKERVKNAGGDVEGVLRFSIQWNETTLDTENDLDAHCMGPNGSHIYYGDKCNSQTTGKLDVDIQRPKMSTAVENITWTDINKMDNGSYEFFVRNFSGRNVGGFRAQIEADGVIYEFDHANPVTKDVQVASVTLNNGKFEVKPILTCSQASKDIWGVSTKAFHKVNMVMNSPNHWDGNSVGNKHYFFVLEDCRNSDKTRGFYNEFLKEELREHRKVFEVLSSKMKAEESDNQLSGLGFSSTQRNEVMCKVKGSFTRIIKIKF